MPQWKPLRGRCWAAREVKYNNKDETNQILSNRLSCESFTFLCKFTSKQRLDVRLGHAKIYHLSMLKQNATKVIDILLKR